MANDLSAGSLLSLAKERYLDGKLEETIYKQSPFLAKVTKKGGQFLGGKYLVVPIRTAYNNASGAHLGNAMAAATGVYATESAVAYQVPRAKLFNPFVLDADLIAAVTGGETGFVDSMTEIMDGSLKELSTKLGKACYRSGYGDLGRVLTGSISTNTFSFVDPEDAYGVEKGDRLVFSASLNANTLRNTGGTTTLTVTNVDHSSNVVTTSANVSTVTGATSLDFVFNADSRQDSATPSVIDVAGMGLWVPDVTSVSTNVMGVNLLTAGERAQGQHFSAAGMPIEEGITKALAQFARIAPTSGIDSLYLNNTKYAELVISLGTRVRYVEESGSDITINFTGIKFASSSGNCVVYADPYCPVSRGYALTMSTWVLGFVGKGAPIHIWEGDSLETNRITTGADAALSGFFEFRGNLICKAPSQNGVILFA